MRAVIIDDEENAAKATAQIVKMFCSDVTVVGWTTDAMEGVKLVKELLPDILFLDVEMPKLNGFEVLEQLNEIPLNVIFTTAYDKYAIEAIKHNALAYLLKPIDPSDLIEAISKVENVINKAQLVRDIELKIQVLQNFKIDSNDKRINKYNLSKREIEISELLVNGKSAKEISEQLFVSIRTVYKHLQNVYRKMKVNSVVKLTKKFRQVFSY